MFGVRDSGFAIRLFGLVLVIAGYFGPWVGHKTAALTVTGPELSEFAKLFPQVQGGVVPVIRALFLTPLVAAAILLGLLANQLINRQISKSTNRQIGKSTNRQISKSTNRLPRTFLTLVAALFALAALPPYQYLLAPEYRGHLVLAAGGLLLVLLTPFAGRLPRRARSVLTALLALAGAVPALWQFVLLHPLVVALYDEPLGLGWGLVVCVVGFALVLISGFLQLATSGQQSAVG
ncbi:MAG: hypothetical protein DRI79_09720 [Chloroflexi bacterium]|nr:MAG: hypothetical protein DRI79_09720 [Chloroflexota bacterium]